MVVWRCSNKMGKVALVTGSSRGIGREIALKLASIGYHVYLHYFMNEKTACELGEVFKRKNYKYSLVHGNLGEEEEIKKIFKQIEEEQGRLDLLVNNAATGVHKKVLDIFGKC